MATIDDIYNSPEKGVNETNKVDQGNIAQQTGRTEATATVNNNNPQPSSTADSTPDTGGGAGGYEEMFRKYFPETEHMTAEQLKKEEKKHKRNQIFAAIGDGIMALSNLFFTSRGAPNMYTGKNTMSERTKVRYDKLMKDHEDKKTTFLNGLMRAKQADKEAADKERSWQRQLKLDEQSKQRYEAEQERKKAEEKYKKERNQIADEQWQKAFDEKKRTSDRDYELRKKHHKDRMAAERARTAASQARGVRGKRIGFADGSGNEVAIYENVWKGSMQQVFNAIKEDLTPADSTEQKRWAQKMRNLNTVQKQDNFVKENWHKSKKAKEIMLTLSGIDPATMTSELNDEEEVEEYTPDENEEVIDYTPRKK